MVTNAFAMAGEASAQGGNPYGNIIMLVVMFAIFYFLLIRPQQKRAKQHKELVEQMQVGEQVVTAGGVHGKIVQLYETTVTLEVASGVKMKFNRSSIVGKAGQEEG
ncbi:MAG: preprotein translocase subunit YajC [Desulfuromonas sp.]|nr:MAG: preprotein translocase subunit YajC [Desulfuromonas sp.]